MLTQPFTPEFHHQMPQVNTTNKIESIISLQSLAILNNRNTNLENL